jgi:fibronectin type 3 domain-containing protein
MAEESVVVKKSRPKKAGNGEEEKTGTTVRSVALESGEPKAPVCCEGTKFKRRLSEDSEKIYVETQSDEAIRVFMELGGGWKAEAIP